MSRFNTKTEPVTNLAGGKAYRMSDILELITILLTSFVSDQFYRSADDTLSRMEKLVARVDVHFAAKSAIYARRTLGMRSVTHALASYLAPYVSGQPWATSFYNKVVYRPDDVTEIIAFHLSRGQKISAAMKKGLGLALNRFDSYQLAKYKGEGNSIKLVDVVNLLHPPATMPLTDLMKGRLAPAETWEVKLSAVATHEGKSDAWHSLITENKLGYLALLRNLRNIKEQAPSVLFTALKQLTDPERIRKAKVFPFQFVTAYKQFEGYSTAEREIKKAISMAAEMSLDNIKDLPGRTLVAIDNSGSMNNRLTDKNQMTRAEAGALFGISLAKALNADVMEFGTRARYVPYSLDVNILDFAINFTRLNEVGHSTCLQAIYDQALRHKTVYDRIVVFSDMQTWAEGHSFYIQGENHPEAFRNYCKRIGRVPIIHSFDLAGYGTLQFPEKNVYLLAGFSDKVFEMIGQIEKDPETLKKAIESVSL